MNSTHKNGYLILLIASVALILFSFLFWQNDRPPYYRFTLIASLLYAILYVEIGIHMHTFHKLPNVYRTIIMSFAVFAVIFSFFLVSFALPYQAEKFISTGLSDLLLRNVIKLSIATTIIIASTMASGLIFWLLAPDPDHDDKAKAYKAAGDMWKDFILYALLGIVIFHGSYLFIGIAQQLPNLNNYWGTILTIDLGVFISIPVWIIKMDHSYLREVAAKILTEDETQKKIYLPLSWHIYIRGFYITGMIILIISWQLLTSYYISLK